MYMRSSGAMVSGILLLLTILSYQGGGQTIESYPPEILRPLYGDILNSESVYIEWTHPGGDPPTEGYSVLIDDIEVDVGNTTHHLFKDAPQGTHEVLVKAFYTDGYSISSSVRFTVDRTRPSIVNYSPTGDHVPLRPNITFAFSEMMDEDSVLLENLGVEGRLEPWQGLWTFEPYGELNPGLYYVVKVKGMDLAGNELVPFSWSFRCVDRGTVIARVVDQNERPVASARVYVDGEGPVFTDTEGYFSIESEHGPREVLIEKEGFSDLETTLYVKAGAVEKPEHLVMENEKEGGGVPLLSIFLTALLVLALAALIFFSVIWIMRERGHYFSSYEE